MAIDPGTAAIASAGIGAAGSLAGGLLGGRKDEIDYRAAKKGIRWKVRDAKAAGIHPLYAVGAPSIGGTMSTSGADYGRAAEGVARAAAQGLDRYSKVPYEQKLQEATLAKLEADTAAARSGAKADDALAAYHASRAAKVAQGVQQGGTPRKLVEELATVGKGAKIKLSHGREKVTDRERTALDRIADIYGDFIADAYGVGNWLEDTYSPMGRYLGSWLWKQRQKLRNRKPLTIRIPGSNWSGK